MSGVLGNIIRSVFVTLMIDEYQDTNTVQFRFVGLIWQEVQEPLRELEE